MISKILNASHWKLFVLTTGLPLISLIILIIYILSLDQNHRQSETPIILNLIYIIISLIGVATQLYWYWAVVIGLSPYMHPNTKLRLKPFYYCFFAPILLFGLYSIRELLITSQTQQLSSTESQLNLPTVQSFIILSIGYLTTVFCLLYTWRFTAKMLKSVEMQREAIYAEYSRDFFLLWFYPVGIWFIQPRINRIVQENQHTDNSLID
jgi:hypothetical protein